MERSPSYVRAGDRTPPHTAADTLDKWIKGTSALFIGPPKSFTEVVGAVQATDTEVRFRFKEVLCFNIPLLQPKVPLK